MQLSIFYKNTHVNIFFFLILHKKNLAFNCGRFPLKRIVSLCLKLENFRSEVYSGTYCFYFRKQFDFINHLRKLRGKKLELLMHEVFVIIISQSDLFFVRILISIFFSFCGYFLF